MPAPPHAAPAKSRGFFFRNPDMTKINTAKQLERMASHLARDERSLPSSHTSSASEEKRKWNI